MTAQCCRCDVLVLPLTRTQHEEMQVVRHAHDLQKGDGDNGGRRVHASPPTGSCFVPHPTAKRGAESTAAPAHNSHITTPERRMLDDSP
jgi:hypothetical protein